jgi:hypothetical protein
MSTEQTESTNWGAPGGQPSTPPAGAPGGSDGSGGSGGSGGEPPTGGGQPAEWGAPPPPAAPKAKWTAKKTIIAVAVAVGIAAAGGVAIYAASGSVDNTGGPSGGRAGGPMIVGGPMGGMGEFEHGEFQMGDITALSDDSVTVKSEDGYEHTYTIDSDTQKSDGIKKGAEVTVIAETADGKSTAKSIMELGEFRQGGPNGGNGGPRNGNGGPPSGNN